MHAVIGVQAQTYASGYIGWWPIYHVLLEAWAMGNGAQLLYISSKLKSQGSNRLHHKICPTQGWCNLTHNICDYTINCCIWVGMLWRFWNTPKGNIDNVWRGLSHLVMLPLVQSWVQVWKLMTDKIGNCGLPQTFWTLPQLAKRLFQDVLVSSGHEMKRILMT